MRRLIKKILLEVVRETTSEVLNVTEVEDLATAPARLCRDCHVAVQR